MIAKTPIMIRTDEVISRHRIVMSSSNYVTEFVGENEPGAYDREEEPAQHLHNIILTQTLGLSN